MTFTTVWNALSHVYRITVKRQSRAADIIDAYAMVQDVAGVYSELRENVEDIFARYYEKAGKMTVDVGVEPSRPRIARKQQLRWNVHVENPEEYYRRSLCTSSLTCLHWPGRVLHSFASGSCCSVQKPNLTDAISMYRGDLPSPTLLS